MSSTHLVLIRHGQTDWNLERKYQGQTDIPLNDTGRAQALEAALQLRHYAQDRAAEEGEFFWDALVSSPLSRAYETGDIIANELGILRGETYDGMKERFFGTAEGQVATRENWTSLEENFNNVEPLEEMVARGLDAIRQVLVAREGQNIILVAHGLWISTMMEQITGQPYPIPENASITVLPLDQLT